MTLKQGEHLVAVHWYAAASGGVWYFAYSKPHISVERQCRKAIKEWLVEHPADHFNWGDAVTLIPDAHWAKYGLRFLPQHVAMVSFNVDHDEEI